MNIDDLAVNEDGYPACPKCGMTSGHTWEQCGGKCPLHLSPRYDEATDMFWRTTSQNRRNQP